MVADQLPDLGSVRPRNGRETTPSLSVLSTPYLSIYTYRVGPDHYLPTYTYNLPRRPPAGSYHYLPTSAPPAAAAAENYLPT